MDEEKSTNEIQEEEIKITKYKYIADDNKEDDCYIFQVPKSVENDNENKSDIKEDDIASIKNKPIYFQTENLKFATYFEIKDNKDKIDWMLHLLSLPTSISNISIQFEVVLVSKMECYSANITFTHNKLMFTFNDFIPREDIINSKDLTFKIFIKTLETRNEKNELIYNHYKDSISWLDLSYLPSTNLIWSTQNKQLMTAMKEYGAGNYKTTNIFDVKSLKFCIKIYPNGRTMDDAGKFCMELVLMTIPPKLSGISVILDAQLTGNGYKESDHDKINHCFGTFNIIKPNEMSLCCDNICTFTEFQKLSGFQLNLVMIFVDIYDISGVSVIDLYENSMNDCKSLPISCNYYEWIPDDTDCILNAENTEYFESDIFCLEGFKWRFGIFPNGYTPSHNGEFSAFLYLAALSPSIYKIVTLIRLRVYGEGIDSECISYSFLDIGEYSINNSKLGWITTGISDITYLSGIHRFKFEITISIIDVFDFNGNKILEYKRLQSPLQHSLSTNIGYRTWNIDNSESITMLIKASNGESFESGFFRINKLKWSIKIYPNGKISAGFDDGDVLLQIELKELIKPIIGLSFQYKFYIKETKTWFTNIVHFRNNMELKNGWNLSHLKTNKLKNIEKLTIKLQIKLLEVYADHNILMTHVY